MNAAATFPVHDAPCEHHWTYPTVYVPAATFAEPERLPLAMLGSPYCARCKRSKLSVDIEGMRSSAAAQIRWGLRYIRERYGKPAPWSTLAGGGYGRR